jgi:peptidyl-prolyl cis-trans isomerase A (cyclophilin A)
LTLFATSLLLALLVQAPPPPVVVVFETTRGAFTVEVDVARAPVTAANFLKYVDDKFYNDGRAIR